MNILRLLLAVFNYQNSDFIILHGNMFNLFCDATGMYVPMTVINI